MGGFVQEYAVLRWGVVAGFVLTALIVVARFAPVTQGARGVAIARGRADADPESDAAHLLMCLVMLAMLIFPMAAAPQALRGVLVAMLVAYSAVLAARLHEFRHGDRAVRSGRVVAFGYHLAAAGAMLWATHGPGMEMSRGGHSIPMALLAALFVADAALMFVPGPTSLLRHALGHAYGRTTVIPHVVMDLGTAYMLVAAATG
ncbi:DUF5134 domain-containing protein [Nocardia sp. NEAU-G5]|uniref:DUF5134 domain-containing protein n=1 Tax=Nocardia albiluteola TaxID=2842303 RepID=A0ABS6B670_9NOCA|nr:DUF5134 domain-containing protein [Nocardia albiluteola]MBU3065824.1 DUF5134 domain-containing protein [Nocardia albiluteola]